MTYFKYLLLISYFISFNLGAEICPRYQSVVNTVCQANEQTLPCEVTIGERGSVSGVVFQCDATNKGWIANSTIKAEATLTGGIFTGWIQNEGTLKDIDFRGVAIIGGTLAGQVTISPKMMRYGLGQIKNVHLAAHAQIDGGHFEGRIVGDPTAPAQLDHVIIKAGSHLSGVQLGDHVQLGKGVIIDNEQTTDPESVIKNLLVRYPKANENVETYWNQFDWADLTADEQYLWTQLGWHEAQWQGEAEVPASEALFWDELSEMEQMVATQLGYNPLAWDLTDVRRAQPGETIESFWNSLDWADLTEDEQTLWSQLGWQEASWQGEAEMPDSEDKSWDDLNESEQSVAKQLGYNQWSWDFTDIHYPQEGENIEDHWNQFDWADLNEAEQSLWAQLGWDEMNWSGEAAEPASENKDWAQLTEMEQTSATQLGYNSYNWNLTVQEVEAYWNDLDWSDLTDQEQALWTQLGWSEANWSGEAEEPASENKNWIQLTVEERTVATQLGYDQQVWDGLPE